MAEERFDAVIVGAGPAGSIAAYTMATQGLKVALIERGEFPGAKNIFGGVLYRKPLDEIIPEFWKEAPLERAVIEQNMWLLGKDSVAKMGYRNEQYKEPNCWTGLRVKFDAWLAGKAVKAGAVPVYETVVTELLREEGKVVGVRTDRDDGDLYANIVVLADGVNSLLAKSLLAHREWQPDEVSLAVKEVIALPRQTIEDRFNLEKGEGVTIELIGETHGMAGLGFLYTNNETLSLGVGVMVNDLKKKHIKPYEVLDGIKQHPMIRRLIQGGEAKEYSGHLIPEGGFNSMPKVAGDGWMIVGDAGQMVNAVHREGTNLAMTSGKMAGDTAVLAHQRGDFTLHTLSEYTRAVRESIIHKDLKKYKGVHGLLSDDKADMMFGELPQSINNALYDFFLSDGVPKKEKQKAVFKQVRQATGGNMELMRLAMKGWRAMNG
ncbi:FAD-dependent oxidoreductase [Alicyclobacillus sp. SO9]|uniref:FAD-dependent oxidoreductase n=1 Tax=Alicyclobacillus sp. SO9 TaxID=2665646 RepID=UPI0018E73ED6|nr:FAD-dependent oxidoreductase [Alicyclobacillus sp. SO9]QQE77485.1 FAD-dependent oxidoreductase [Alicyclobacillus sp. SO9]